MYTAKQIIHALLTNANDIEQSGMVSFRKEEQRPFNETVRLQFGSDALVTEGYRAYEKDFDALYIYDEWLRDGTPLKPDVVVSTGTGEVYLYIYS